MKTTVLKFNNVFAIVTIEDEENVYWQEIRRFGHKWHKIKHRRTTPRDYFIKYSRAATAGELA